MNEKFAEKFVIGFSFVLFSIAPIVTALLGMWYANSKYNSLQYHNVHINYYMTIDGKPQQCRIINSSKTKGVISNATDITLECQDDIIAMAGV